MKKNILIATDSYLPRWDGVTRFLTDLIPYLKKHFKITIIAPKYDDRYKNYDNNIDLIQIPLSRFNLNNFPIASSPKKEMIEDKIIKSDIIFIQTISSIGKTVSKIAKNKRKKIISYTHSIEWELVPNIFNNPLVQKILRILSIHFAKKIYNKHSLLIHPSVESMEKYSYHHIYTKKKVVNLGVNIKIFKKTNDKISAKKRLNIDPLHKVICFIGRLGKEKDLITLYRAFIRLKKDYQNLTLLILGDGLSSIKNIFEDKDDIILVGQKDNVLPYLHASDIFVLPSLTETTSLSTLEAMSCGVIPVCTHVGLIKHYIKNGVNGYTFKKRNAYILAKKIEKILNDPVLKKKLSENAIKTVKENFNFENSAKKIIQILENI